MCALDAEWEPYTPKPSASLVQAAVRMRNSAEQYVLLLVRASLDLPDGKQPPVQACSSMLRRCIRCTSGPRSRGSKHSMER